VSSWIARLALPDLIFAAVLVLIVVTVLVLARRRGAGWPRLLGLGLFGGYLVILAMIILCPLPTGRPEPMRPGERPLPLLQVTTALDLRGLLSGGLYNQNLQNLLLAVPFGFGLASLVRWRGRLLVGACLLLGVGLEGAQAVAALAVGWAYRSIDINDLICNDAGALLGLVLFAVVNWRFSFRPGPSGRTAAVGTLIAACVAIIALVAGPTPHFDPGESHCDVVPAAGEARQGYSVYLEQGTVCLIDHETVLILTPDQSEPVVYSGQQGVVNVAGLAPAKAVRVLATLPDGRSARATLRTVDGLDGRLVYVARVKSTDPDAFTAQVTMFAAGGARIADVTNR